MHRYTYRSRDFDFGQTMLKIRTSIGLTQAGLSATLGVSRHSVGEWESGASYPKPEHLQRFVVLAVKQQVFSPGHEAEEIKSLWIASHQKALINEIWLKSMLLAQFNHEFDAPALDDIAGSVDNKTQISLPLQPTQFIGRLAELSKIASILNNSSCRLLTLLGPGGIGKTRLAIESATKQASFFKDGVAFVALAHVDRPVQIVPAIANALKLPFIESPDPLADLLAYLDKRQMLLVLDNFEHLLDGSPIVEEIITRATGVSLLVTSRERLHLQAEWLVDVQGLESPPVSEDGSLISPASTDLTNYGAVQLFIQRATQILPHLFLSEEVLTSIVHICTYLAGIPLAIELAAMSVRLMSVPEIERQVGSDLDVLETKLVDMPERHRSLRAAFNHSWNLLTDTERRLFCRLAIFRCGCTFDAAQQIAHTTLSEITKLTEKCLIFRTFEKMSNSTEPDGIDLLLEARYMMLEPLREYALGILTEEGEIATHRDDHANFYLSVTETNALKWWTPNIDAAIKQIEDEGDNIRAALEWSCIGGDPLIGLRLACAMWRFWHQKGTINEGRGWLNQLLDLTRTLSNADTIAARLRAIHGAGWLASDQHDFKQAADLFEQGRVLRQALGEKDYETSQLLNSARQARTAGNYQAATNFLEEALARHRALGDRGSSSDAGLGLSLYELALISRERGNFERANTLYKELVELGYEIGDIESLQVGLLGLSDVARDQGDIGGISKYGQQALTTFRNLGMNWAIGFSLNNLAQAAYLDGNLSQAFDRAKESESLFRRIKDDSGLAEVLVMLGRILLAQAHVAEARQVLMESVGLAYRSSTRLINTQALEMLGCVLAQMGDSIVAIRILGVTSTSHIQMDAPVRPVDKPIIDKALTTLQSLIGLEEFLQLWQESGNIALEQITEPLLTDGRDTKR